MWTPETHNNVDKQFKKAKIQVWIKKLWSKDNPIPKNQIEKELGPTVYIEARTRSIWRCYKVSFTLIKVLDLCLVKKTFCIMQNTSLFKTS
jgi:hypothetical protein